MLAIEIPQYEYRSGVRARQMAFSLEMHYGSELFGKTYNDPVTLTISAITIAQGMAIPGIMGGLMIAGGIASGLGSMTGNKTLSMIGTGLSIASFGASAFTNATTGAFMNPFVDGNFANSSMSEGFSNIKKMLSGTSVPSTPTPTQAQTGGLSTYTNDMGVSLGGTSTDTFNPAQINDITNSATNAASNTMSSMGGSGGGGSAGSGGGLLSQLGSGRDLMALAGGLADGYQQGQQIEQNQPLVDARIDQINADTQLAQNRYNNMQAQPNVNIGVNSNANIYGNRPSPTGKVAVVVNGKVQYLTAEQYAQLQQAQQAQTQQPTGLLAGAA